MLIKKRVFFILFMLFQCSVVHARMYEIIREHSKISFDLDYMVMSNVDGNFKVFHGYFDYDEQKKILSKIKVEIKSSSVDTNDEKRDFHLRGHEFLFVDKYPLITFVANGPVQIKADNTFSVAGKMTIRGITRPITFEGLLKGQGKDAWGKDNTFFTLKSAFNRKDFNMTWNKQLDGGGYLVGDDIKILIVLQTQFIGDKTPFSTHMVPSTKGIVERELLHKGKIKKLSTSTDPKDHKSKNKN